ncbi:hypothetical protein HNQ56_000904 [Anaerotaenia torta]|uniref:DUF3877 family protein n=1 Tax=Anaerotaenia torta TaxID=433293 RepID=UPI003D2078AD
MNYDMLEKVICDTIKEEQIKLGYEKETIRLYYPMRSLANILEEDLKEYTGMDKALEQFALRTADKLGRLKISHNGDRYCILIPPAGAAYVHENYGDNPFLSAFIDIIRRNDCTLEQIMEVFYSFSGEVECEKSATDEFDYVIYFRDNAADDYRYCIKFDYGHTVYHRFTPGDFENLMEEVSKEASGEAAEDVPEAGEEEAEEPSEEEEEVDAVKEERYQKLVRLKDAIRCMTTCDEKLEMYKKAVKQFKAMGDYKESGAFAEECKLLIKETRKKLKKKIYKAALDKKESAKKAEDYKAAAAEFRKLSGYKDADDLAMECETLSSRMENRMVKGRLLRMGLTVVAAAVVLYLIVSRII